jgi:hypothetical protein
LKLGATQEKNIAGQGFASINFGRANQTSFRGNIKGWTSERYMPRLLNYKLDEIPFDFPELIGALAPRACFVNAPLGDTNFKWRSVDRVMEAARPVYKLFGAERKLRAEHPDCGHLFPREMREAAYQVIDSELKRSSHQALRAEPLGRAEAQYLPPTPDPQRRAK